ncbi:MAG: TIGR03960 family B12-binding radical SAM protein, partial [Deltaproteobacteria bacterium]
MTPKSIQDFLPLVERPSRYLGSEINTIRKDLSKTGVSFALAFPDLYEIGTSHFGIQILYQILNKHPDIAAERVFAPAEDVEALLRSSNAPLTSLETNTPLKKFNIIGFSLLYELNYTNILTILDLAGIPFLAKDRDAAFPLVIGGGPCACNPEPLADFFDAFVIGDGEEVALKMAKAWLECRKTNGIEKAAVLDAWSSITGVYIPAMFPVRYNNRGFQVADHTPEEAIRQPEKVTRAILADLDSAEFPQAPILPYGKPIHDRLRLEVSRGCTRGCRFCQAGMIYRPVRERSEETLMKVSRASLDQTGYEDISLLSLSTGDYSCISSLMASLMATFESSHTAVSLPSLRAGTLTPELMAQIKRVRKTGFTIAPEAGSQRLRNVINKNITRDEIVETVKNAFGLGWKVIKLYFMIGLPTETDQDLQGIIDLVEELRKI